MEIPVLRAPGDPRVRWVLQANQEEEAVLVLMVPGACQESLELRATVVLMAFLVYPVTKDTGVTQDHWDPQGLKGRTERGETTEKLDPGVSQVNQDLVVCSDPKALRESLDLLAYEGMTGPTVPRETWVPKESQDLQVSREPQELREWPDLKEPSDPRERKVPQENQVCQECLEPTALQVTQERRGLLAPKETRVPTVPRVVSAILALVASREVKESVD